MSSSFAASQAPRSPAFHPLRFVLLLLAPLLVVLTACSDDPGRLARADAKYALEVLERAPEHGFPNGAFGLKAVQVAVEKHDPKANALLRQAVIDYARAQHGRLIPTRSRPAAWGGKPPPYDAAAELDRALRERRFRAWLDELPPPDPLYRTLQQAYVAALPQVNTPQGARNAAVLRANLERLRWLPREDAQTRIDVNIASATLLYVEHGQPRLSMRTASGKPGDETPVLASKIDHIVLNPPWNVPEGIAQEELLPKGPEYLAANGFTTGEGGRLIQSPGPESALGLVKFDFDNPYAVYLHDTPSKAAFDRSSRAVSHGCVRLERALDLANLLLAGQAGWSPQRIADVIASRETTTVKLDRPVPVRLLYLTAVPSAGAIVYQPDVYGWDAEVLRRLDRAAGART